MYRMNKKNGKLLFTVISFILISGLFSCEGKQKVIEFKGGTVTEQEVNTKARMELYQNEQERYQIQMSVAEQILYEKLLKQKAKEKSITVDQLLGEVVSKNFVPVTDSFIKDYYDQNKAQIGQPYEQIKETLREAFNRRFQEQMAADYYQQLKEEYNVKILLPKPKPPEIKIDLGDDPALSGNSNSKVQVVEFSDFECPYCKRMQKEAITVREKFGDKIHWVFKDFPLPMHAQAMPAHIAANCAAQQDKYVPMHDALFDSAPDLGESKIKQLAQSLGLQMDQFNNCIADKNGKLLNEIEQDIQYGQNIGVNGTPALFINGKFYNGYIPAEQLEKIIELELQQ